MQSTQYNCFDVKNSFIQIESYANSLLLKIGGRLNLIAK